MPSLRPRIKGSNNYSPSGGSSAQVVTSPQSLLGPSSEGPGQVGARKQTSVSSQSSGPFQMLLGNHAEPVLGLTGLWSESEGVLEAEFLLQG